MVSAAPSFDVDTPIGVVTLRASERGLRSIDFLAAGARAAGCARAGARHTTRAVLAACAEQLQEYFAGERERFDLPLDPVGTAFQLRAWAALREIPFGETRSYSEQAAAIGAPRAARAVGAANARNPIPIVVPCHRVVGARGALTGFSGGLARKRALLIREGAWPLERA
ncbi:MAG: methylated-DNA--[protein]-cysteine S-methyltransferase [Planctomycetota bacterium]